MRLDLDGSRAGVILCGLGRFAVKGSAVVCRAPLVFGLGGGITGRLLSLLYFRRAIAEDFHCCALFQ